MKRIPSIRSVFALFTSYLNVCYTPPCWLKHQQEGTLQYFLEIETAASWIASFYLLILILHVHHFLFFKSNTTCTNNWCILLLDQVHSFSLYYGLQIFQNVLYIFLKKSLGAIFRPMMYVL